jgi:hypothetical protein
MESSKVDLPKPKRNIAKIIMIVVIVFVCSLLVIAAGIVIIPNLGRFSIPEAPEGYRYNGIASTELQDEAKKLIKNEESVSGCETVLLTAVDVLNLPQDVIEGNWAELWHMDACGEEHTYAVTFSPNAAGGIDVAVLRTEN